MAGPTGNETNHVMDGLTVRGGLGLEGPGGVVTYLNRDAAAAVARQAAVVRGQGFITETFPRCGALSGTISVDGTVYGTAIGLLAGDVITNMTIGINVAGNTTTIAKLGIYSQTGTLLCSSADGSAGMGTAGLKTMAMTTPFTVTADGLYYAAWITKASVTLPTPLRGSASLSASNPSAGIGAGTPFMVTQTGQTDFPASATLVASVVSLAYWMGIS
jgi:hypothetical protein